MSKRKKDNNSLGDMLILGGIGYLLGQGQFADWKPLIENYKKRLEHLKYFKIPLPMGYLQTNENIRTIYRESILCYLFGLSNSAIPSLMRVLEQALMKKYEDVEGKKPSDDVNLKNLIDWADNIIEDKTQVAHSFRMLRNYVHTDTLVQEQDVIEAVRHISIVTNDLFPTNYYELITTCKTCGRQQTLSLQPSSDFLGNAVGTRCGGCYINYNWISIP